MCLCFWASVLSRSLCCCPCEPHPALLTAVLQLRPQVGWCKPFLFFSYKIGLDFLVLLKFCIDFRTRLPAFKSGQVGGNRCSTGLHRESWHLTHRGFQSVSVRLSPLTQRFFDTSQQYSIVFSVKFLPASCFIYDCEFYVFLMFSMLSVISC